MTNHAIETEWERVQVGARMEKRMVKVLKALAEYLDVSMGDLIEGIVLHTFESKSAFSGETLEKIGQLKKVYGMNYGTEQSHCHPDREEKGEKS